MAGQDVATAVDETEAAEMATIGIDLGDKQSHFCVLDEAGEVVESGTMRTTRSVLAKWFGARTPCQVVFEAGTHSPWVNEVAQGCGFDTIVANPRELRMIYASKNKNDRVDAEKLARVARLDVKLLAPIEHRSEPAQCGLGVVRQRAALVRTRTTLINCVRGVVKSKGLRIPTCDADNFSKQARLYLADKVLAEVEATLQTIDHISKGLGQQDEQFVDIAKSMPIVKKFQQVPGIGAVTSVVFALVADDPKRFDNSRALGAYLGMTPRRDQSGASDKKLGITKAGDPYLRQLLVQCAQRLLQDNGPDCELRRWGLSLVTAGKGGKQRAIVAVARKYAVLLHRMWITGANFEPEHHTRRLASKRPALQQQAMA